jgi:hypothetical protein
MNAPAAERDPPRFDRAAARWVARYLDEEPGVQFEELRLTVELLGGLATRQRTAAASALRELFAVRGRADLVRALAPLTKA